MSVVRELGREVGVGAACAALEVAAASYYRWCRPSPAQPPPRPRPPLALSASEEQGVLEVLNGARFVDLAPPEAYARLLGEGTYLCSTRTLYRVLERHGQEFRPGDRHGVIDDQPFVVFVLGDARHPCLAARG